MSDYIDRRSALKHLYKRLIETANNNVGFKCDAGIVYEDVATDRLKTWINEVPSEDVQPVRHGHWIEETIDDDNYVYCSECHDEYIEEDLRLGSWVKQYFKYCPNCGASMDGVQNE